MVLKVKDGRMIQLVQFFSGISILFLLIAEYRKINLLKFSSKPIAAFGFVLVAILYGIDSIYDKWIFVGLIFSFLGDCFLLSNQRKVFLFGLISFLIAHIFYAIAFYTQAVFSLGWMFASLLPITFSILFFLKIKRYLAELKIPVLFYLFAINTMLIFGLSCFLSHSSEQGWTVYHSLFLGALLFYLSDLAVARERFVQKSFLNRLWGLPFYFLGQFLIASTIAYL